MVSKQTNRNTEYEVATLYDSDKDVERNVFLHEYVYTMITRKPIPIESLVFHNDSNTLNNNPNNLTAAISNNNDYHEDKDKVFHEHMVVEMLPFLREHFPDVLEVWDI